MMNPKTMERIFAGAIGGVAGLFIGRALASFGLSWQWVAILVFIAAILLGLLIGMVIHRRGR